MNQTDAEYYRAVGYFRASGLSEAQAHARAERMFTYYKEQDIMTGFTDEQIAILQAAFDHVWARMASLHDDLNEDSLRVAALLNTLEVKKVITAEQFGRIMKILDMEASERREPEKSGDQTENTITGRILQGDLSALEPVVQESERSLGSSCLSGCFSILLLVV